MLTRHSNMVFMMNELVPVTVSCPYCGEGTDLLIDGSEPEQEFIEDCQVCCRPITVTVSSEVAEMGANNEWQEEGQRGERATTESQGHVSGLRVSVRTEDEY